MREHQIIDGKKIEANSRKTKVSFFKKSLKSRKMLLAIWIHDNEWILKIVSSVEGAEDPAVKNTNFLNQRFKVVCRAF